MGGHRKGTDTCGTYPHVQCQYEHLEHLLWCMFCGNAHMDSWSLFWVGHNLGHVSFYLWQKKKISDILDTWATFVGRLCLSTPHYFYGLLWCGILYYPSSHCQHCSWEQGSNEYKYPSVVSWNVSSMPFYQHRVSYRSDKPTDHFFFWF